jgi:DNA-binding HxlR family transcriptional regulator
LQCYTIYFRFASSYFQSVSTYCKIGRVAKRYNQYCPVASALDLVGERWSLLIVRELLHHGPMRYSDLHCQLEHCGTNILAARLKELERGGVVQRRKLPPPAASTVYELTPYGEGLRPVLHQLAHWGARAMGPPTPEVELEEGWLRGALQMAFPPCAPEVRVEFRMGGEVASLVDGEVREGGAENADAVVTGDPGDFYRLVVDRDLDAVEVSGRKAVVADLLVTLPPPAPAVRAEAAAA